MAQLAPDAQWLEIAFRPSHLVSPDGQREPLDRLHGARIAAFCGIGNPAAFRRTLEQCHYDVAQWNEFPDHFAYDQSAITSLTTSWDSSGVEAVACTQKDLVKLDAAALPRIPVWAVAIEMRIMKGEPELIAALERISAAGGC